VELYLFRHGEAGSRLPLTSKDQDRALTAEGKEDVMAAGKGLLKLGVDFDVVAASPLKRAKDTASILNSALKRRQPVEEWDELKPEGSKSAFYRRLAKLKFNSTVLCVGHEPYLTAVIGEITSTEGGGSAGFRIVLKKAGMAKMNVLGFSPTIRGELRWLLTPRQVRKL
jgi:phosphohistidine phosphatase